MNWLAPTRRACGLLLLGALCGLAIDVFRRDGHEGNPLRLVQRPTSVQTRDDAALLSGWLERLENSWEVGKNHEHVKAAFEEIIAAASKSTVRVMSDGEQVALGTIVDSEGYILTKASEVENCKTLLCQFLDRRKRKAEIIGTIVEYDLAMLKVDADRLTPAPWSDSENVEVGSLLATTYVGRDPLAVGVCSLASHPIANDVVLGVRLKNSDKGPFVTEVIPHTAADEAGLEPGDIVSHISAQPIGSSEQFVDLIGQRLPGDTIELSVEREDRKLSLRATLGRRTDSEMESGDFQSFLGGELSFRRSGFPSVLQHDTFLLPHHCGGPLVDLDGKVVGINIARAERIASYAVPAAAILPRLEELKSGKLRNRENTTLAAGSSTEASNRN